jgi:hypothetical protein
MEELAESQAALRLLRRCGTYPAVRRTTEHDEEDTFETDTTVAIRPRYAPHTAPVREMVQCDWKSWGRGGVALGLTPGLVVCLRMCHTKTQARRGVGHHQADATWGLRRAAAARELLRPRPDAVPHDGVAAGLRAGGHGGGGPGGGPEARGHRAEAAGRLLLVDDCMLGEEGHLYRGMCMGLYLFLSLHSV